MNITILTGASGNASDDTTGGNLPITGFDLRVVILIGVALILIAVWALICEHRQRETQRKIAQRARMRRSAP